MPTPQILLQRLTELAREERKLRILWGLSRWLAVMLGTVFLCCLADWLIDIWYDTPSTLRFVMRLGLIVLAVAFFYWWIIHPLRSGLTSEALALWIEERDPQYGHRLISAVQLNATNGKHSGMSMELIEAMTGQAESSVTNAHFTELLDTRRKTWSRYILISLLVAVLFSFLMPMTISALLQRQLGSDIHIPRGVQMESKTTPLWPSGEPVTLQFLVQGSWSEQQKGIVEIVPEGQLPETYELTFADAGPTQGQAHFTATIPASSTPFTYHAWLYDGRTYEREHIAFAPRPILTSWEAWLQLPSYIGSRPNGKPFERAQPKGDLRPIPGSSARIEVVTQTPVVDAMAELLGPITPELGVHLAVPVSPVSITYLLDVQRLQGWTPMSAGPLLPLQRFPLNLNSEGTAGSALIELPLTASAYRVLVKDQHGFTNRPIPRRAITFKADDVPQVTLLPERYGSPGDGPDDLDLEGMPVPLGRPLRIAYRVRDDFALESARLRYRINEGDWQQLSLIERKSPIPQTPFDLNSGSFTSSGSKDQIPFFAIPAVDAKTEPGRSEGGGRFDFQTRAIPGLKLGDVLEYFIEVNDRHPDPNRSPGRSVVRRKTIVTEAQFVEWVVQTLQQENRLRQLERQQRRVFEPGGGP